MRKAFKVLYFIIGVIIAFLCSMTDAMDNIYQMVGDALPKSISLVIAFIVWILVWPIILLVSLIGLIYQYIK